MSEAFEGFSTMYDPDPARRRKGARRGKVPPQLRSWVFRKRRRSRAAPVYEPRRRRRYRSRARYDPRKRTRRRFPRFDFARRRRRHFDPSIRGMTPFWSSIGTPVFTMLGSILHNWLSLKKTAVSGAVNLPMGAKITHLGAIGAIASALLGYYGRGATTDAIAHIGAGMAAEGFNVPAVESVSRPEGGAGNGGGAAPYVPLGAYQ